MFEKETIPYKDLKIIFEGFEAVCDEYAGSKTVNEVYLPIYEKYKHLFMEEIK